MMFLKMIYIHNGVLVFHWLHFNKYFCINPIYNIVYGWIAYSEQTLYGTLSLQICMKTMNIFSKEVINIKNQHLTHTRHTYILS